MTSRTGVAVQREVATLRHHLSYAPTRPVLAQMTTHRAETALDADPPLRHRHDPTEDGSGRGGATAGLLLWHVPQDGPPNMTHPRGNRALVIGGVDGNNPELVDGTDPAGCDGAEVRPVIAEIEGVDELLTELEARELHPVAGL